MASSVPYDPYIPSSSSGGQQQADQQHQQGTGNDKTAAIQAVSIH